MRVATITLLVIALAGCGEPALTMDDYRDAVSGLAASHATEVEEMRSTQLWQMEQAVKSILRKQEGEAAIAAAVAETGRRSAGLFAAVADSVARYAKNLDALAPPAAVEDAHREYVTALSVSTQGLDKTLEALAGAESLDALDAAIGGSLPPRAPPPTCTAGPLSGIDVPLDWPYDRARRGTSRGRRVGDGRTG